MNTGKRRSPFTTYGVLAMAVAFGGTISLMQAVKTFDILSAWLLSINITTLLFLSYDKIVAGGSMTRIPERILVGLAFAGGSPMALVGMKVLRHKTSKHSFQMKFWSAVAIQLTLVALWYFWLKPKLENAR